MLTAAVLALGGGVLTVGCSSSPQLTTEGSFCQAVAQADCSPAVVAACYLSAPNTLGMDTQSCINFRSSAERCNPQNLPFHAEFAQPCVDAHTALYQQAALDPNALAMMNLVCEAVFNRGGPTNMSCTTDTDCDVGSGLACVVHASGHGTCQIPVPVSPGESCASPASQCSAGFFCEASGHCVSNPVDGGACGPGIPCATTFRCVMGGANGNAGVCHSQLPDMSPCMANTDCVGGFCVPLTASSLVCAGQIPTLAFGTPSCAEFVGK
jgi:hypothetical protein